ncbi:baseplate J/gp47 family protein [Lentilactobacillus sp. SPB1-3]|uniref:Baseplate J/gp47 family protein n=1 Tax=Lentilactobacillus terminaliae TaxID=3003483 RepID=A0ACD5DD78_9LACO|nr:baseplate J/gp47 family protein [Lentilactobacillus sp. SPB1-3]MCZ0978102.1 baseplate J/gp47 family protein [Lentilactobacillus sp. SPB1-3]
MPLLSTGFDPWDYDQWLNSLQTNLRQDPEIGNDIDLSTGSFYENMAESLARQLAQSDLTKQDVYDSRFVSLAENISLDRLASNYGLTRGVATYATAILEITGTPGYVIDAESMFSNNQDMIYITDSEVTIDSNGKAEVRVYAEDTGEDYNCDANMITDQVTYVEEITSVTNPEPATSGSDMETDYALRQRIKLAQKSVVSSTPNGVSSALFGIPGVKSVRYVVNNSSSVNEAGDPPYTTHIYVLGGDRQVIAQTISDTIALGITLTGTEKIDVPLDNGDVNHVAFSIGSSQTIYMNISVSFASVDDTTQDEIIADIKDNIQVWLDEFSMGDILKYTQLFGIIYDVEGVDDVTDLTWGTDQGNLNRSNIQLSNFATAITNDEAIEVVVNG